MPRIRTIKPDLWGSGDIKPLSRDARLLFIGLISMADDDGRFLASLNAINGYVYPNDDLPPAKVRKWLNELTANGGPVHLYANDGIAYGCIPKWHKHQVINRYTASRLPEPDCECYPRARGVLTEDSVSTHGARKESSLRAHDGKGREGKGREMSQGQVANADPGMARLGDVLPLAVNR